MPPQLPRVATLVLVDAAGSVVGALAPIGVETPWWNDIGPLVGAVRARDGVAVTILRLLAAQRTTPHGGGVTYLAQADSAAPAGLVRPWAGVLPEHPLRHAYARVGGPHADLVWARSALASRGATVGAPPRQIRSWNLSSLWRLPLRGGGAAWLKVVPPFFAHEGAIIERLAGAPVPRLLGRDGCRMLLAEIDGEDLYAADETRRRAMIELLVELQAAWLDRADELLRLGLPDWRADAITPAIAALVEGRAGELRSDQRDLLASFVSGLPARFAAIAACGMPDGLVHGDFHTGNFRGSDRSLTLLDWGDSGVGHPLLDQSAFLDRTPAAGVQSARGHWVRAWKQVLPRAAVQAAAALLAPVASARQALIYQRFLDQIEETERIYHRGDVVHWLARTANRLRSERVRGN